MDTEVQHDHIGLKLPHDLAEEVRRAAEASERSVSAYVRLAIRERLEREDGNGQARSQT